jgi:hypothetical protein
VYPKRVCIDHDGGDVHEILPEVDNWDLRVHLRESTLVQNRLYVEVGSLENQPTRPSWSGCVDFILVSWGLCSDSHYTCDVDQDTRSHRDI